MAIPSKDGQSWLTSSMAIVATLSTTAVNFFTASLNAAAISLPLPVAHVVSYTSNMEDYATCGLPSHYLAGVVSIATSSVRMTKNEPLLTMEWSITTTNAPGVIDYILYSFRNGLEIEVSQIEFNYGTTNVSGTRFGLFVNASSGSPHFSLYPQTELFLETPPRGEVWMSASGSIRFVEQRNDGTGAMYIARPTFARLNDTTASAATRFSTVNRPREMHLGMHQIVANQWFMTANSPDFSGSGFINQNFGNGLYMPDANTVAVYGPNVNFLIPSGSLVIRNSFNCPTGLTIRSDVAVNASSSTKVGFVLIPSGNVSMVGKFIGRGRFMTMTIDGSGSRLSLNGAQAAINPFIGSGSHDFSAVAFDGDWYLYSGSGLSGSNLGYVRANSQWFPILSSSDFYPVLNGGFF